MMKSLVMCLAGPMQAWGVSGRFTKRETQTAPSKSGVLGILAAAQGVRRTESIEHLLGLTFGVRVDQSGSFMRDFQVARSLDNKDVMPLSTRYYLADSVFVAAVHGDAALIDTLVAAILRPRYPLYLGRRSCPPSRPLYLSTIEGDVAEALSITPWQASERTRRKGPRSVVLRTVVDGEEGGEVVQDVPISFDPRRREYGWRNITESAVTIANPLGHKDHDPMSLVGG